MICWNVMVVNAGEANTAVLINVSWNQTSVFANLPRHMHRPLHAPTCAVAYAWHLPAPRKPRSRCHAWLDAALYR